MTSFASAALYNLVVAEVVRAGLAVPPDLARPIADRARIAAERKRALLEAVLTAHGPLPILRSGEGIRRVGFDPTLQVLRRARAPAELVARWCRLERFHHSHHRIRPLRAADGMIELLHHAVTGPPPRPAEDLLIAGLLVELLRGLGCLGIEAAFTAGAEAVPFLGPDGFALARLPDPPATAAWTIRWRSGAAAPAIAASCIDGPASRRCAAVLAADLARRWSLAELADGIGLSRRSLQRRLRAEGASLRELVARLRLREACRLLGDTGFSLGEIGYWCGYSDQAHFTRDFRRRTNVTPAGYRGLCSPAAAQAAARSRPGGSITSARAAGKPLKREASTLE